MESDHDMLQLLHRWLACDEEAGRRLWFDTGLFFDYWARAVAIGWRYVKELGKRADLTPEAMESCAAELLLHRIYDRLKPSEPGKRGKTAQDFPTAERFHNYLSASLEGIKDIIKDEIGLSPYVVVKGEVAGPRLVPLEKPLPAEGQEDKKTLGDTIPDMTMPGPHDSASIRQRWRIGAELVMRFRQSLNAKTALPSHFAMLVEAHQGGREDIVLEGIMLEIIVFLEFPKIHYPEISDYFIKTRGMNEDTYATRNRRLRHEWRKFCEGPGRDLYQQCKETQ